MRLDELLVASAARTPEAVAAMDVAGNAVSYKDLDKFADDVARALVSLGVGKGDRVGLCVPKSIGALVSVFGILKAGAAYVPVDYSAPAQRNGFIFNNCEVKAIVAFGANVDALHGELGHEGWSRHPFPLSGAGMDGLLILVPERSGRASAPAERDLAYILYTSGSTGLPKGVMHSHATAMSFVDWCSEEFKPTPRDRFSSHAPFHFDLSILDIYVPIKHGASVVLIGSDAGKQPGTLSKLIAERRITVWYSTPSILRMLVEHGKLEAFDCSSLRLVLFAGEVFPIKHLRALMSRWPHPVYYNLYGPTETNVCTYFKLPKQIDSDDADTLPIGRACSGDQTRVVLASDTEVPRGDEGELIVTGGSVMLGYWNLPDQNARAFLSEGGKQWYRTGDIVREGVSGDYMFLGRRDRMVKRRGYRVELGEIEAALHRHPAIPEAAVIAATNEAGEIYVHAFIAWTEDKPASVVKLKQFCSQNLPIYMVPDRISVLAELPKTSTDKIDYQRLRGLA
jgi:L-proline---[L-prolyl-carrier protein] ligase